VLFCDVVGSTALGESVDPETLQGLLARYFERMNAIVKSHEGSVEKFISDAVTAVFGVPQVHEDDALRACRAAVQMRAAFPEFGVQGRIALNTDEVVAGTEERLATGDTLNVAARLLCAACMTAPSGHDLPPGETPRRACRRHREALRSPSFGGRKRIEVRPHGAREGVPRDRRGALVGGTSGDGCPHVSRLGTLRRLPSSPTLAPARGETPCQQGVSAIGAVGFEPTASSPPDFPAGWRGLAGSGGKWLRYWVSARPASELSRSVFGRLGHEWARAQAGSKSGSKFLYRFYVKSRRIAATTRSPKGLGSPCWRPYST
jgi:class 3 adenylate cyclase